MRNSLAAVLILIAVPAGAGDDHWRDEINQRGGSAWGLHWYCTQQARGPQEYCEHVIATTLAVHRSMVLNHPHLAAYCWPKREPSIDEAREAFLRWYRRLDVKQTAGLALSMEAPAGVALLAALREAAPCP